MRFRIQHLLLATALILWAQSDVPAQRLAIVAPDDTKLSKAVAKALSEALAIEFAVDDLDLSRSAFDSIKLDAPYNMRTSEAALFGKLLGTNFFTLIRADVLRRTSFEIDEFYEAYAATYLVDAKTGTLIRWQIFSGKGDSPGSAQSELLALVETMSNSISRSISASKSGKVSTGRSLDFPEVPEKPDSIGKDFRPPMPYRRLRPEYTEAAFLYSIAATIEVKADIDAEGSLRHLEIVRWAGYGLDESVAETLRKMNWRPATVEKKTLPMRVLLRYNFVKLEKNEVP